MGEPRVWSAEWGSDGSLCLQGPFITTLRMRKEPERRALVIGSSIFIAFAVVALGLGVYNEASQLAAFDVGTATVIAMYVLLVVFLFAVLLLSFAGGAVVRADSMACTLAWRFGSGKGLTVQRLPWSKVTDVRLESPSDICQVDVVTAVGPTSFGYGLDAATAARVVETMLRFRQMAGAGTP